MLVNTRIAGTKVVALVRSVAVEEHPAVVIDLETQRAFDQGGCFRMVGVIWIHGEDLLGLMRELK